MVSIVHEESELLSNATGVDNGFIVHRVNSELLLNLINHHSLGFHVQGPNPARCRVSPSGSSCFHRPEESEP